jgi:hypothetical protein
MSRNPSHNPDLAWVRCQVPRRCHELALEASRRLGIPVTMVYTCILTRDLWRSNREHWLRKFIADVGADALPSTDSTSVETSAGEKGGNTNAENHGR